MFIVITLFNIIEIAFSLATLPPPTAVPSQHSLTFQDFNDWRQSKTFDSNVRPWLENHSESTTSTTPLGVSSWRTDSSSMRSASILTSLTFPATQVPHPVSNTESADSAASVSWKNAILKNKNSRIDKVKRVVDASTIQLDSLGFVSLDTVRGAGSTFRLPECMTYAPSYKLKKLLPAGTSVRVTSWDTGKSSSSTSSVTRVWIVREQDEMLVNQELVRTGYAFVRKGQAPPQQYMDLSAFSEMMDELTFMEQQAKLKGLGIFKLCSDDGSSEDIMPSGEIISQSSFVAEFEPLEFTTETKWGDDGGKTVIVSRKENALSIPPNPGDTKGCSDFDTYEQALSWYETYAPYYGDVAKLDRDGDGVPCPGLPHTTVREMYRMKRPIAENSKR